MTKQNDEKKTSSESNLAVVKDFGKLGKITKENLDAVFENDLTALARRAKRYRRRK